MATKPYSGAWARRAAMPTPRRSLWNGPDPEHSRPSPNPGTRRESWDTTGGRYAPTPDELTSPAQLPLLDGSGGGWVVLDQEPLDHDYGLGAGAGLPLRESMRQNAAAHKRDRGATRGRRFASPARQDGDYHATLEQLPAFVAGSPGSVVFQQESTPETSPNAAIRGPGKRQNRWWDRRLWREVWTTDPRPAYTTTAYTAPPAGPVPGGSQYTSPYATAAATTVRNVVTVRPQLRRNPRPWDEGMTTDGSTEAAGSYGFFSGGL